jgi:hypothetical protein
LPHNYVLPITTKAYSKLGRSRSFIRTCAAGLDWRAALDPEEKALAKHVTCFGY